MMQHGVSQRAGGSKIPNMKEIMKQLVLEFPGEWQFTGPLAVHPQYSCGPRRRPTGPLFSSDNSSGWFHSSHWGKTSLS